MLLKFNEMLMALKAAGDESIKENPKGLSLQRNQSSLDHSHSYIPLGNFTQKARKMQG